MLETHIRGRQRSLLANLRAFPPRGTPDEVWNHGIGQYTARFTALPGRSEREVKVDVELVANSGSSLDGQDEKPRVIRFVYTLVYGYDGTVDEIPGPLCDWIALGGEALYCPLNVMEVVETRWRGYNPYVTEANVRVLDLANGGHPGWLPGSPPQFRAVPAYGAGRAAPCGPKASRGGLPVPPRPEEAVSCGSSAGAEPGSCWASSRGSHRTRVANSACFV